jgi:hypothetical protein
MARVEPAPAHKEEWIELAQALAQSIAPPLSCPQYLVDVSHASGAMELIELGDHGSLKDLLLAPPPGVRIEPVCLDGEGCYRYARRFTLRLLGCPESALNDDPAEFRAGDVMLVAQDAAGEEQPARLQRLRDAGVKLEFCVGQPSGAGLAEAVRA